MEEQVREAINDPELDPRTVETRNALFDKYVSPYQNLIYKLCINYTTNKANVQENYNDVLVNFYRGIETYNPTMSIITWLHIVTKRHVFEMEKRRRRQEINKDYDVDIECCDGSIDQEDEPSGNVLGIDNYREYYNDDILAVLDQMKDIHRDALIYQESGYSLKEIAEIEFKKGRLKSRNIETIKSRLFHARQFLQEHLTRDGERRKIS